MAGNWKKQFALIYAGQAFSLLGSAAVQFAIIWWLTIQTESAMTLTTAAIVAFIPNMVFGPVAGVWIDRCNRRTVIILADGFIAASSAVLALVFLLTATPPVWMLYVVLFLRGLGTVFHAPAMQAAIPMLVPVDMLTKAGGWGNLVNSFSNMLGPVLGALLMGFMPKAGIMLVDILGAAFAIGCLLFVHIPDVPRTAEKQHIFADMKAGLRAILTNKPLVAVFIPMLLVNILYMPLGALFPLLVRTHFMGEAWHNGVVEFIFAGGLLLSSLVVGLWGGMKRRFLMVSLAIGLLGAASWVSGILPVNGFWVFAGCCFFMGMSGTFINVPLMAYTQESTAPEMMGKVFAFLMTAMMLAMPVGLLIAGPLSEAVGVDRWFAWSGAALVLTAILCRVLTKPFDRPSPTAAAEGGEELVQPAEGGEAVPHV